MMSNSQSQFGWGKIIMLLFVASMTLLPLFGQMEPTTDPSQINSDSKREEIQRYFGYEDLFFRYTTLPYDVSQNTNEIATFLDIGFLYLLFLPLVFVFVVLRSKKAQVIGMFGLTIYLISCFYYSKILSSDGTKVWERNAIEAGLNGEENRNIITSILIHIYELSITIFGSFKKALGGFDVLDPWTYPTIIGAFLIAIFLALRIEKKKIQNVAIIYLCFSLLFFMLSAGIIWYGFLLIPLSLIFIFYLIEKKDIKPIYTFLRYSFYSFATVWILLAISLRISNIQFNDDTATRGENILFPNIFSYSLGKVDEAQSLEMIYPNIHTALNEINKNEDLIFKIGTSLSLHIKKNNERLYNDNQLAMFHSLYSRFGAKNLFPILKEYGFGYIIIDLHTASIDRTPNKTLTKKYTLLQETMYNNPNLRLVATDRILTILDANGQNKHINGIFGQTIYFGNYAIFKII